MWAKPIRQVNKVFKGQIRRNMVFYVDNMLVKSWAANHTLPSRGLCDTLVIPNET